MYFTTVTISKHHRVGFSLFFYVAAVVAAGKIEPADKIECPSADCRNRTLVQCVLKNNGKNCKGDFCVQIEETSDDVTNTELGCGVSDLKLPIDKNKADCDIFRQNVDTVTEKTMTVCTCRGQNQCATNIEERLPDTGDTVKCHCDDCKGVNKCSGTFCTFLKTPSGRDIRGCAVPEMPFMDMFFVDACMEPPILNDFGENFGAYIHSDLCTCKKANCNEKRPKQNHARKTQKCKKFMKASYNGPIGESTTLKMSVDLEGGHCYGEQCFDLTFHKTRTEKTVYEIKGCITYLEDWPVDERRGCLKYESENEKMEICLHEVPKEEIPPPNLPEVKSPPKKIGKNDNHQNAQAKHLTQQEKDKAELDNESGNTTIIAVFVVIMVIIVIAGVVWKFELHKKIFQSRYQSVSG